MIVLASDGTEDFVFSRVQLVLGEHGEGHGRGSSDIVSHVLHAALDFSVVLPHADSHTSMPSGK